MAEITAAMVKELREKTDAPMMECKKALAEASAQAAGAAELMTKAEEILRVKLGSKASKASSRVTAEGVIGSFISSDNKTGALIEINCETDFVAKNNEFVDFVKALAQMVAEQNPADVAALSSLSIEGMTVDAKRAALIGKIGENLSIRRFKRFAGGGDLVAYIHGAKIGVMVEFQGDQAIAKDVAMHIAAMKPVALVGTDVAAELIEKERSIAAQKAAESGKPADIVAKMVEGSVQKFLKEVALLDQPFVKNDKQTVAAVLKAANTTVKRFELYVVGEGIEKKVDDFAAEVAKLAGGVMH